MSSATTEPGGLNSWGVVGTMDEPAALIAAWVAHHLTIGASEVHVFLDRPNPEAEALLQGIDRVTVYQAGDDGWVLGNLGHRPQRHQGRQKYNATRALWGTKLDWMIHCDADEFISPGSIPLAEELALVDQSHDWMRLPVEERVWTDPDMGPDIFAGPFRRRLPDFELIGPGLYGTERASHMNAGLSGHIIGKACVRSGRGHVIQIHRPARKWRSTTSDLPGIRSEHSWLLHFNGMTRLHYVLKMLRRGAIMVNGKPSPATDARRRQFNSATTMAADPEALKQQWWGVQGIDPKEARQLRALGVLIQPRLDLVAETRAVFGDRVDLSQAAFDRALVAHEADNIAIFAKEAGFDPVPLMAG